MDINGNEVELPVAYPLVNNQQSVYIGSADLTSENTLEQLNTKIPRTLYLFGGRVPGERAFRTNYVVQEFQENTGSTIEHYMAQRNSIFWKEETDLTGHKAVDMIKRKDCRSLVHYPKWKPANMSWPTYQGEFFTFAKQFYLPANKTTQNHLYFKANLFLFVYVTETDSLVTQVMEQETGIQTAKDHYRLEEAIIIYHKDPNDIDAIKELIRTRGKDFQEFLLDQKNLSIAIIEMLVENGKTKAVKNEALSRLKEAEK